MSDLQVYQEIFTYPIAEFKRHLEQEGNDRILFSGKYGMGKTSFLKNFFKPDNVTQHSPSLEYEVYHLYPVNYSIASNEDIVKYIKYDIIWQFLLRKENFPSETPSYKKTLPAFIKKNLYEVLAAFIYMIPKIGKNLVDAYEKIKKLKEEFEKYHDDASQSEFDDLAEYLSKIQQREGSIYENDILTKTIASIVERDNGKKTVLVIDDLDRIDPEHVFRIMNVFAAHLDRPDCLGSKNKFGFDTVILVCDYRNIKNLFHHRYGSDADFKGYVDKFYSSDVYHFDNREAIDSIIDKCWKIAIDRCEHQNSQALKALLFGDGFLGEFIPFFVKQGSLNLRSILRIRTINISIYKELKFGKYLTKAVSDVPITIKLGILSYLFGDVEQFKKSLKRSEFADGVRKEVNNYLGHFIDVLNINEESRNMRLNDPDVVRFNDTTFILKKESDYRGILRYTELYNSKWDDEAKKHVSTGIRYNSKPIEVVQAALKTVDRLIEIGYLN